MILAGIPQEKRPAMADTAAAAAEDRRVRIGETEKGHREKRPVQAVAARVSHSRAAYDAQIY